MATSNPTVTIPTITGTVDQTFFIDRLGGPRHPWGLLDRFPDDLYNKAPETHIVRLLYALLGPAGVGWLQKQYLDFRLDLIGHGIDLFNLEAFYGNPLRFGRTIAEAFNVQPIGLLDRAEWDVIRAQDERYRSRIMDFTNGARLGNTPDGIRLVARSGLGHDVEIVENYKYLFGLHSDEYFPFDNYGATTKPEEFVILPRRETSRSAVQSIDIVGGPTGGTWTLTYQGATTPLLSLVSTNIDVQNALQALPTIGDNNVVVDGGPGIASGVITSFAPYVISFTGQLSNRKVPLLEFANYFTGGSNVEIVITSVVGGLESADEAVLIPPADQHHMQYAVDRIRPQNTLFSTFEGTGVRARQNWNNVFATSEYNEIVRYVTGNPAVVWPSTGDGIHWIEAGQEHPAPRIFNDLQHHYVAFHNVAKISAYTEAAIGDPAYLTDTSVLASYISQHHGPFNPAQVAVEPILGVVDDHDDVMFVERALASYPEPLTVTTQDNDTKTPLINGIYPQDYASLTGVPQVRTTETYFWASLERPSGDEYLEIDLGDSAACNFLSFEISKKPITIEVAYDLIDQSPRRKWQNITPTSGFDFITALAFAPEDRASWFPVEYHFEDAVGNIPITRFLRLKFSRIQSTINPFLFDFTNDVQNPWSIEIRNLRIGRNASD